ncbi:MAG: Flp pilus assembly pilin Flp [Candidatus Poriferisodalaceae bacterium]|jgi:Flp pilus assembly pilin Flp
MSQELTHHSSLQRDETGQTTAEYALLTGAIALVIAAVTAWAAGTGKIGALLNAVFDKLASAV